MFIFAPIKYTIMLDVGLTTFMILATSLVMLMTPGLAFFYGGLGCNKNILSIMMQSFVSMGIGTVLWFWLFTLFQWKYELRH